VTCDYLAARLRQRDIWQLLGSQPITHVMIDNLLLSDFSTQIMVGTASQEGNDRSEKELAQRRAVAMREFHNKTFGKRPLN
jgi:hypothetical protein